MPRRKSPVIADALLDQRLDGADARTAFDTDGLLDQLKIALVERALNADMDHHLVNGEPGDSRNGYGRKTLTTGAGKFKLEIQRDRAGGFDPARIAKRQRRFPGFDEKIISMHARGMSLREIAGHVREIYGVEVSADLISAVADAALDEPAARQARPLEAVYPLIFFDALRVKIRDEGAVRSEPSRGAGSNPMANAVHIALGVRVDGAKEEVLGLWLEQNEVVDRHGMLTP